MIVTNDYKFSSNIDEVTRSFCFILFYFFTIRFHKYKKAQKIMQGTINILRHFGFLQDKILSVLNTLVLFRIRFYIKCRLKVSLALFIYMYFYLKATVKKSYHDDFNNQFSTFIGLIELMFPS